MIPFRAGRPGPETLARTFAGTWVELEPASSRSSRVIGGICFLAGPGRRTQQTYWPCMSLEQGRASTQVWCTFSRTFHDSWSAKGCGADRWRQCRDCSLGNLMGSEAACCAQAVPVLQNKSAKSWALQLLRCCPTANDRAGTAWSHAVAVAVVVDLEWPRRS